MGETVKAVERSPASKRSRLSLDIADGFVTLRNMAGAVAWILIAMLLIISLFIIANTIKLATFHRREEIAIMKMCGATNCSSAGPFFEGMILGPFGCGAGVLPAMGHLQPYRSAISEQGACSSIAIVPFQTLAARAGAPLLLPGLAIGACGSLMAIRGPSGLSSTLPRERRRSRVNRSRTQSREDPGATGTKTVVALLVLLMALLMILPMITVVFQTAGAVSQEELPGADQRGEVTGRRLECPDQKTQRAAPEHPER